MGWDEIEIDENERARHFLVFVLVEGQRLVVIGEAVFFCIRSSIYFRTCQGIFRSDLQRQDDSASCNRDGWLLIFYKQKETIVYPAKTCLRRNTIFAWAASIRMPETEEKIENLIHTSNFECASDSLSLLIQGVSFCPRLLEIIHRNPSCT